MTPDLARLKTLFPSVEWEKPQRLTNSETGDWGFACRVCIASDGITGTEIQRLPQDPERVRQHIQETHT